MGSPITFSGLNGIDFSMILNAVMAQERQPLTALETQKTALQSQNSIFTTLAGKLASLKTSATSLGKVNSLAALTATSSDAGVGVSTTGGTVPGTYQVVVSELARAQVTTSQSTYTGLDAVVATGGSLTFTPATGAAVTFAVTASTSLKDFAAQINANSDSPVSAAAVQTSTGIYKLVFSAKATGTANAFTVTNNLTGGLGLTLADGNANGISGDSGTDNSQTALNAALTVNSLAVTSSTNTITDVVPGVTLTLKKKDPLTTVTVDVVKDNATAKASVKSFISAFNDIMTFAKDQATAAVAGKASIGRDPLLRNLRTDLREIFQKDYAGGATYSNLASLGVGFAVDGKMVLDEARFEEAMTKAPADAQKLFSGATGTGGAFGALSTVIDQYTQVGGLLSKTRDRIDDQVKSLTRRLDAADQRLEIRRQSLQREFIAADMAMSQLKSQGSALSNFGGEYRLF